MIRAAVCDDEQIFLDNLRTSAEQFFTIHNIDFQIFEFRDGESLLLSKLDFDIILMDLKLPGIHGMEVIEQLRKEKRKSQVIFVTSYQEYSLQAFQVDAVHYLMKPISDVKLAQALERAMERMEKKDSKTLAITKGACTEVIFLRDILYCEAMEHRIYIHTATADYDYLGSLRDLQKRLDDRFFRCHKSYIVNMTRVVSRQEDAAIVEGGGQVLISRRKQQEFVQKLLGFVRKELL